MAKTLGRKVTEGPEARKADGLSPSLKGGVIPLCSSQG